MFLKVFFIEKRIKSGKKPTTNKRTISGLTFQMFKFFWDLVWLEVIALVVGALKIVIVLWKKYIKIVLKALYFNICTSFFSNEKKYYSDVVQIFRR